MRIWTARVGPPVGILVAVLLVGACGKTSEPVRTAAAAATEQTTSPAGLEPSTPADAEAADVQPPVGEDGRVGVSDGDGNVVGTMAAEALDERREAVTADLIAGGYLDGTEQDPVTRRTVTEALQAVHAIEVVGEDGSVVGYVTVGFVTAADYPAVRAEAERVLSDLRAGR